MIENKSNTIVNQTVVIYPPYPGYLLRVGSTGSNVSMMQSYLNALKAGLYPTLNYLKVDGIFGSGTQTTVMQYQSIKRLKIDGIIGQNTWNAIVLDYGTLPDPSTDVYPGVPLRQGDTGPNVLKMQQKLNILAQVYTAINTLSEDGIFGGNMANATRRFQMQFNLSADAVIGELTWNAIINTARKAQSTDRSPVLTAYPGYVLSLGSSGDYVRCVQSYLNTVFKATDASYQLIAIDGIYGRETQLLVRNFQVQNSLSADGKVGPQTWARLIQRFNAVI